VERYLPLLDQLDDWQARARADHPGVIPCRPGCSACCRGPFDIQAADALLVLEAVAALPPAIRQEVRAQAARQVASMRALVPGWSAPYDIRAIGDEAFDAVSDALADQPCPCLDDDGRCVIYSSRPLVCRLTGLGMVTESGFTIDNACPIRTDYPAYARLAPRPFPLEAAEPAEVAANQAAALALFGDPAEAGFETTIAGAVAGVPRA
jgi:Fe-S-cluster containining protein